MCLLLGYSVLCHNFGRLILNLFVHTYNNILYNKYPHCIYVLPQDGPCWPKHVGEIIMTKQIFILEYLQLVGINTL